MVLQRYSKTRTLTMSEPAICRFLPKDLAYLLTQYLCIIRPVQRVLASSMAPENQREDVKREYGHWLFVSKGKRMTDQVIRDSFTTTMAEASVTVSFSGNRYACFFLLVFPF